MGHEPAKVPAERGTFDVTRKLLTDAAGELRSRAPFPRTGLRAGGRAPGAGRRAGLPGAADGRRRVGRALLQADEVLEQGLPARPPPARHAHDLIDVIKDEMMTLDEQERRTIEGKVEASILAAREAEKEHGRGAGPGMYHYGIAAGVLWTLAALGLERERNHVLAAVNARVPDPDDDDLGEADRAFITGLLFGSALDPFGRRR